MPLVGSHFKQHSPTKHFYPRLTRSLPAGKPAHVIHAPLEHAARWCGDINKRVHLRRQLVIESKDAEMGAVTSTADCSRLFGRGSRACPFSGGPGETREDKVVRAPLPPFADLEDWWRRQAKWR